MKKLIKIKAEINKIKHRPPDLKTVDLINKTKSWFLEKKVKQTNHIVRLIKNNWLEKQHCKEEIE